MPELPEVETTMEGIRPYLQGRVIQSVAVRESRLRWPIPDVIQSRIQGSRVVNLSRRGKYILTETESGWLIMHLGMSGSFRVLDAELQPGQHDHYDLITDQGMAIRYNDPRRFGSLLFSEDDPYAHVRLQNLGLEPLTKEFSGGYLYQLSKKRTASVKSFIMDGKVVVGVGNIYASESLFRAGIHPTRRCNRVSQLRYSLLVDCIVKILTQAIQVGGTTLQDFAQVDGSPGYFEQSLMVYGRAGEPCYQCGSEIKTRLIGQRSTFYCSSCQK